MTNPVELMLDDLKARYAEPPPSAFFSRLYTHDERFGQMFASLHEQLNGHFESINDRARSSRHYWAESSRNFLALIVEVRDVLKALKTAGFETSFSSDYQSAIDTCRPWLVSSGGSAVPDGFQPINLIKYEAVFVRLDMVARLKKSSPVADLTMVGEGSYATVYSFVDPDYDIKFAVKRAKKRIGQRDLLRFRKEFEVLKGLSFPYIIEVYRYNEQRNEYKMEYCDETLRQYVRKRNSTLSFGSRKRIALQLLYGVNYIHTNNLLHRDLSLQNVLLKVYKSNAVLVKLSDFGLVKDQGADFTRTETEMRGTIRDPILANFRDYGLVNELYAVGWVLSFIFTGKESLVYSGKAGHIVEKCTVNDPTRRYRQVLDVIADVERLEVGPD